jgi:hypothetical protein
VAGAAEFDAPQAVSVNARMVSRIRVSFFIRLLEIGGTTKNLCKYNFLFL